VISIFLASSISCEIHADGVVDALVAGLGELFLEVDVEIFLVGLLHRLEFFRIGIVRRLGRRLRGRHLGAGREGRRGNGGRDGRGVLLVTLACEFGDIGFVDELDAHLIDHHEKGIEPVRRDHFVGQLFVEFLEREVPARRAHAQQRVDACFHFLRRT
jgi:hypothetical protein